VFVGVLGVATLAIAALRLAHPDILPGVSVEGIELGGTDDEEARERLAPLVEARTTDRVTMRFDQHTFELEPADVGFEVDVPATIERARRPGRTGSFVSRSWDHVEALWRQVPVGLVERVDEGRLEAWVASIAAEVDAAPFPGAIDADPDTLAVTTRPPAEGAEVDQDATTELIRTALESPGPDAVDLPVTILPARIDPAQVEQVAVTARAALVEPLVLTAVGSEVVIEPGDLARLLELREVAESSPDQDERWRVELGVPVTAVEELFGERAARFEVAPVDATFAVDRAPPVTLDDKADTSWTARDVDVPVVPSQTGRSFDASLAAAQIADVLADGRHQAELRLRIVEPELTTEEARALGIDQLLGTFTTYHSACSRCRVTNIQRLADMVDGAIVEPGEQFSVNQISGERTCSKGFVPAGMILNGELVDACGGGVSQFGTTAFNAAFFAALPIDQYKAHSWFISRYPMGREATLNLPSPDIDVRWTNDTGHGILVRTSYTATSITVSLYGHNGGRTVRAIHGEPTRYRGFSTRYRENKALPPGAERRIQSGAQGFDVTVVRVIEQDGDELDRESFFTRYVPITQIVERNSDTAPPPPSPAPSPSPTEPASDGGTSDGDTTDGDTSDGG